MPVIRLTISELAKRAGMTPRNIRLYQTRGLLARPAIEGREAIYSEEHVQRLALVKRLQADGLSLELIHRVLHERGNDSGLSMQLASNPTDEIPRGSTVSVQALGQRYGMDRKALETALAAGALMRRPDGQIVVQDPELLDLAERGMRAGVSLQTILSIWPYAQRDAAQAAAFFVELIRREIWQPFDEAEHQTDDRWQEITTTFEQAPHLAAELYAVLLKQAIQVETARAVEAELQRRAPAGESAPYGQVTTPQ